MNKCTHLYNKPVLKNKYLNKFYKDIQNGHKILKNTKVIIETVKIDSKFDTKYIPDKIYKFIKSETSITYKVSAYLNNKKVNLFFTCYDNTKQDEIFYYANYSLLVIYLLTLNTKNSCSKQLDIKIYLTPFKKIYPKDINAILGPNEVNTGFSTIGCMDKSEIVIYRKEEWYKVLIHELMHNLNFDFATIDYGDCREKLAKILNLDINYEINETYCEIWARIISIIIAADLKSENYTDFQTIFGILMMEEIFFSLQQANKILKRVNSVKKFKEDTNAYAYYVFTSGLMVNYSNFVEWCYRNNTPIFNFNKTKTMCNNFCDLIINSLDDSTYNTLLTCLSKISSTDTLRMTKFDIL